MQITLPVHPNKEEEHNSQRGADLASELHRSQSERLQPVPEQAWSMEAPFCTLQDSKELLPLTEYQTLSWQVGSVFTAWFAQY